MTAPDRSAALARLVAAARRVKSNCFSNGHSNVGDIIHMAGWRANERLLGEALADFDALPPAPTGKPTPEEVEAKARELHHIWACAECEGERGPSEYWDDLGVHDQAGWEDVANAVLAERAAPPAEGLVEAARKLALVVKGYGGGLYCWQSEGWPYLVREITSVCAALRAHDAGGKS